MARPNIFDKIAAENLPSGETLITRFLAAHEPSGWWYLLFGPFYRLATKNYLVLRTDKSYIFLQFSLFSAGKPKQVGKFNLSEIRPPTVKEGMLTVKFKFQLPNGRVMNLKVSKNKVLGANDKVRELFLNKAA